MRYLIALIAAAAAPLPSMAAPLDPIIDAMLIPAAAPQTNSDWKSLEKVASVRWAWPASKAGANDHTMSGTLRVPGVGVSSVSAIGSKSFLLAVQVVMPESDLGMDMIGRRAARIATTCDRDNIGYSTALYRLSNQSHKPVFVAYESSQGAGGAGDTSFTIAADPTDALSSMGPSCNIKK